MQKTGRLALTWVGKYDEKALSHVYRSRIRANPIGIYRAERLSTISCSLTRAISRSTSLSAARSHIIRRMHSTAIRSVCSLSFWRKPRMLSVGLSHRSISLACFGKLVNSIILIFLWRQLQENLWSRLRI